jgi:hypothetical protein
MSFTINKEITTKLDYKEIACISSAIYVYQEACKDGNGDKEILDIMTRLVNRLGVELYNCEQ